MDERLRNTPGHAPKAFAQLAVALARRPGTIFMRAAADLGISESMLHGWFHQAEAEGWDVVRGHGVRTEGISRFVALERGVRILREKREKYKKSTECVVRDER